MVVALQPGSVLYGGKYRILRLLGEGGMGSVFEAEHTVTHKRVAIKTMRPELANKPKAADRLVQEARASARIRHPNVVDVYDVEREGELIFLLMEYLDGEPLTELLARGAIPMPRLIGYLVAAMRGVAAAHRQGVVHRDIKPDNIFLARVEDAVEPVVKVLDFGISKLEPRGAEALSLTRSGAAIGTPLYMSPEQLRGAKDVDGRADVYAFGVILYEAVTGVMPYDAESYPELIFKVTTGALIPARDRRPELPGPLDRIIAWALACDRTERIPSVQALIDELEVYATEAGFRAEMTLEGAPMPLLTPRSLTSAARVHRSLAEEPTQLASNLRGSSWPGTQPTSSRRVRARRAAIVTGLLVITVAAGSWWMSRAAVPHGAVVDRAAIPAPAALPSRTTAPPSTLVAARVEPTQVVVLQDDTLAATDVRADGTVPATNPAALDTPARQPNAAGKRLGPGRNGKSVRPDAKPSTSESKPTPGDNGATTQEAKVRIEQNDSELHGRLKPPVSEEFF